MLRRFADKEALSRAAAELFAEQAQAAVADHGRFVVLLAGGEPHGLRAITDTSLLVTLRLD